MAAAEEKTKHRFVPGTTEYLCGRCGYPEGEERHQDVLGVARLA